MMAGALFLCIGQVLLAAGVANADTVGGPYAAAVGLYLFVTVFSGEPPLLPSPRLFATQ